MSRIRNLLLNLLFIVFFAAFSAESMALECKLIVSPMHPSMDPWNKTPTDSEPTIHQTSSIYRNQNFTVLVFCNDYAASENGQANVTVDLYLEYPTNKKCETLKDVTKYQAETKGRKLLGMCNPVHINFDNDEPLGKYKIRITAKDHVNRSEFTTEASFELKEMGPAKEFVSEDEFGMWLMKYYKKPDPARAIQGIWQFMKLDPEWIEGKMDFIFFMDYVLTENPFVMEYYAGKFDSLTPEKQKKLLFFAALTRPKSFKLIIQKNRKIINELIPAIRHVSKIKQAKTLSQPNQLDALWGTFFASGRYDPILKLAKAIELLKNDKGIFDKVKAGELKITPKVKIQFMQEATPRAAIWSLKSNCKFDKLIMNYCKFIYENEELSGPTKSILAKIVDSRSF